MRKQKLLERARNQPANLRFGDLCKLAEAFDFAHRGGKGSHRFYVHSRVTEALNFQPIHGKAKPYQVEQLLDLVEKYGLELK